MSATSGARKEAEDFLANPRFHLSVTVNAGAKHGDINISYADYGKQQVSSEAQVPTILFTPGMFGSRYIGAYMHVFAEKHNVRVLVPDRFGFGKTPNIPLEDRIDAYVAVVPKFLEALGVKHVALASHSAGTFYNMNLLWHCRQILHPEYPMAFFYAPFVDGACSEAPLISALQGLPVFSFVAWNKLANFFVTKASVVTGASAGLLTNLARALVPGNNEPSEAEKNRAFIESNYGLKNDVQVELEKIVVQGMFGEETVGANREALMCLKKGPSGLWGEADDMRLLVRNMASRERDTKSGSQGKLRVKIFFAESDVMTGKKGQDYFQSCWVGEDGEETREDCFDIKTKTIGKSDHDSVLTSAEALEEMLQAVSGTT